MSSEKVVVFGGTGWVGHNVVKCFVEAGYDVTVCSRGRKSVYNSLLPPGIGAVSADKSNPEEIKNVFASRFDIVIDTLPSEESVDNIAEFAGNIKHYIHCSSTGGYAPLAFVPGDETFPYSHFMGGWEVKAKVDAKVMDLCRRKDFPGTVIRPTYITGPGMLPLDNLGGRRAGFLHDILSKKTIDLPENGMALLQPVYVGELANAFLLAVQNPKSIGEIYNICQEKAVTLLRYIEITAKALNVEPHPNLMPIDEMLKKYGNAADERGLRFLASHMCFDTRKAKEEIGFRPQRTTEEAIAETALAALKGS